MSFFSVGGDAGFAAAPVLATPIRLLLGLRGGWLVSLVPLAVALALAIQLPRLDAHRAAAMAPAAGGDSGGVNQWGAFGRLTGVLLARSVLFYGLNTFIPLYRIGVLHQSAAAGGAALATLLIAGGAGTLLGGRLAERFERRRVVVVATASSALLLLLMLSVRAPLGATAVLAPLALGMYVPSSILVVLGQEYLPARIGTASGVTLGLAVSAGGLVTPAVGFVADRADLHTAMLLLVVVPAFATVLAVTLPRAAARL